MVGNSASRRGGLSVSSCRSRLSDVEICLGGLWKCWSCRYGEELAVVGEGELQGEGDGVGGVVKVIGLFRWDRDEVEVVKETRQHQCFHRQEHNSN